MKSHAQGWVRRPTKGKFYGEHCVSMYGNVIRELFNEDLVNSSDKAASSNMLEKLKPKCGKRYSYPRVTDIQTRISSLVESSKHSNSCVLLSSEADMVKSNAPTK